MTDRKRCDNNWYNKLTTEVEDSDPKMNKSK